MKKICAQDAVAVVKQPQETTAGSQSLPIVLCFKRLLTVFSKHHKHLSDEVSCLGMRNILL